jgi:hypothetical protein
MDYTILSYVKLAMGAQTTVDDSRLVRIITEVSRAIDRHCTGVPDAVDYFKLEDVANEQLRGQIDLNGRIICYPHKPIVNSVSAFSFRESIIGTSYTVASTRIDVFGPQVEAYATKMALAYPARCLVTLSYNGGLSTVPETLPADLINAATVLAVRFYREEETGLTDAIGVAELSTLVYTKAWPDRVIKQLAPFVRRVGWRFVA